MSSPEDRIIALIDMDCFFCQVESRDHPELKGQPLVVSQNNVVLAVSYEARALGVTRFIRSEEAKEKCPTVNIVNSPISHGKSDNTKYRMAGQEVIQVLKQHCPTIERASIDEAYLDITKLVDDRLETTLSSSEDLRTSLSNTFVVGYCGPSNDEIQRSQGLQRWLEEVFDDISDDQARRLAIAAVIVEELRREILQKCSFTCSAGISYNKVLAKLACGLHKPNKQTILSSAEVSELFTAVPVNKVRNLGGKIGKTLMENLNCNVMSDLMRFTLQDLLKVFDEKTADWLFNIARGVDNEPVTPRLICKSIAASKNFFGKAAITDLEGLKEWVGELAGDLVERLEQDFEDNNRRATTLTVCYHHLVEKKNVSQSKSCPMGPYNKERIAGIAFDIISRNMQMPIVFISLGTSKFVSVQKSGNFVSYFKKGVHSAKPMENLEIRKEGSQEEAREISKISREGNEEKSVEDRGSLIKLQEIFPDLNDIDHSVLALLPMELQDEAKLYIKNKESPKVNNAKSKMSSGGVRNGGNTIKNFVVKNSSAVEKSSMIRCSECDQMIQGDKFSEHCDFHVAQNLQKSINRSLGREVLGDSLKRNREKSSSPKSNKKTRSIDSYFSKFKNN
ncbi:DNA polymerase eta-like [Fopius arisanus]|uniref:DNA polymerase eta n=1 Tax=Fopius arisanus TaxID=64838 RepID=A0A9R1U1J7_9HYME|nr:PREDICTED: DNA polymerase eta-like [Fopius arisanus]